MIDATFLVYLVHFKVLDLLVSNWGHISFWIWALVTVVMTIVFTSLKRFIKI